MSLDKAVLHGKEHRKPYRGAKRFDLSCRPHGGGRAYPCPVCKGNRLYADLKARGQAGQQIREAFE